MTLTGPPGVGQEPARSRGRALARAGVPGRHLARRLRAGGRRGRRRPAPRARRRRPRLRPARARDFDGSATADALVVLDACEHVLEEAARIASTLLADCSTRADPGDEPRGAPRRERGRVSPSRRSASAAVELFLERARAARPGFEPDAEAVALAAEIVRRVDGLPLAIELAAARVNVLGLGEIVSILERRAALLRDGPASDPGRTALQALVEWSYDLLHGDEKTLLQQLAVHRGGASLASLAAVAATHGLNEATVAYLVAALVDKSIVSASFVGGAARYDMLDTVREYVLERLAESGGLAAARARPRRVLRGARRRGARSSCAGRNGCAGNAAWSRRTTTSGLRSGTRGRRPTRWSRPGSGRSGWYFALADRVSEGRRFLELALSADGRRRAGRVADRAARRRSATSRPRSSISTAALAAGERAVSLAAGAGGTVAAAASRT